MPGTRPAPPEPRHTRPTTAAAASDTATAPGKQRMSTKDAPEHAPSLLMTIHRPRRAQPRPGPVRRRPYPADARHGVRACASTRCSRRPLPRSEMGTSSGGSRRRGASPHRRAVRRSPPPPARGRRGHVRQGLPGQQPPPTRPWWRRVLDPGYQLSQRSPTRHTRPPLGALLAAPAQPQPPQVADRQVFGQYPMRLNPFHVASLMIVLRAAYRLPFEASERRRKVPHFPVVLPLDQLHLLGTQCPVGVSRRRTRGLRTCHPVRVR